VSAEQVPIAPVKGFCRAARLSHLAYVLLQFLGLIATLRRPTRASQRVPSGKAANVFSMRTSSFACKLYTAKTVATERRPPGTGEDRQPNCVDDCVVAAGYHLVRQSPRRLAPCCSVVLTAEVRIRVGNLCLILDVIAGRRCATLHIDDQGSIAVITDESGKRQYGRVYER
jgi:hypothetical protein